LFAALSRRTSVILILLLIAGATQVCWAHAILMESTPKLNSTVKGPDFAITLRYTVRIDGGRSRGVEHRLLGHGGLDSGVVDGRVGQRAVAFEQGNKQ